MSTPAHLSFDQKDSAAKRSGVLRVLRPLLPGFLLYALLTLTLNAQSLWWDEGISLHLATSSWAEIVRDRAANIHPPLYFFLLKLWVAAVGATPFAARYSSVLCATLLPSAAYAFLRRRLDARAARAAALLLAVAPPFVIYGQELRAYAALPLLFLALLALIWPEPGRSHTLARRGFWRILCLALVQASFALLHYAGVIAVAWANLVLLLYCWRSRDARAWQRWALSLMLAALLMLPWLLAVLATGAVGLRNEAGLGNALSEPLPWLYLGRLLGVFHTVGLPAALADPALAYPALGCGAVFVLALLSYLLRTWRAPKLLSHALLRLLGVWVCPFLVAPLMWISSPQAHPRYLLPFVLAWWLLCAALSVSAHVPRIVRGALLALLLANSLLGLRAYLCEPRYARSDARALAASIAAEAQPGDVVLVPATDWSLAQYDVGAARLLMLPDSADDAGIAALLAREITPAHTVYAVDYQRGALDLRGQVRTALAQAGAWVERRAFQGVFVDRYRVDQAATLPECAVRSAVCVASGGPCLLGVGLPDNPRSGGALPLVLCWNDVPGDARYVLALRLYAASGALISTRDVLLVDADLRPTEAWSRCETRTYHTLDLPLGLLPQVYTLEMGLYPEGSPGETAALLSGAAPASPALPIGEILPLELLPGSVAWSPEGVSGSLGAGLHLDGGALDRTAAFPGQRIFATLWLQAASGALPDVTLELRQGERLLAAQPILGQLAPLSGARPLLAHESLLVPSDCAAGSAQLFVVSDAATLQVGEVTLDVGEHTFTPPELDYELDAQVGDVATLLGFDLAPGEAFAVGDPVTLTLAWRADPGAVDTDLTVFVHLLGADGAVVAQHDAKPLNGTRPTGGWVSGEILLDAHPLVWSRAYNGPATLLVGFYDAQSGTRSVWSDGQTAWPLPLDLEVLAPAEN